MSVRPAIHANVEDCVENTLTRVGKRIGLAMPLGLGKPNRIANEFFRRARADRTIKLRILTGLTLERPRWNNGLEQRFLEPLAARIFGDYPDLAYATARRDGSLPPNVEVVEFFYPPASLLSNESAQQSYISANYTQVVRDLSALGVNVLGQLVAPHPDGEARYSLSCNTDLSLDLLDRLDAGRAAGGHIAFLGEVNRNLPYMGGEAEVEAARFDGLVESQRYTFDLYGPPNPAVSTADYMIAMHAACLIKDGGTLQLGIGAMADAVTYALQLRHQENEVFRKIVGAADLVDPRRAPVADWGGLEPFEQGLYASTEMLVAGYLELYRSGILKRAVYDDAGIQSAVDARGGGEYVDRALLESLLESGAVAEKLDAEGFSLLVRSGVFRDGLEFREGRIRTPDARVVPIDMSEIRSLDEVEKHCLGTTLRGGVIAHAGFFLGPRAFYDALSGMDVAERDLFRMTRISFVNQLYGDELLKRAQRRHARFLNTGLMATATGAIVSDGLEDGRVLSGVGGQYNFVAMAHALEDARSILMIRAVRMSDGDAVSNVVWNYGHTTIPRHLRDIVVTEYGIADLRGKRDDAVIDQMISIADSRFQDELVKRAIRAHKLPKSYRIPDRYRNNNPERLETLLSPYRNLGTTVTPGKPGKPKMFARFPYGTDYTDEEIVLGAALKALSAKLDTREFSFTDLSKLGSLVSAPKSAAPYLERLGLEDPQTISETIMQKAALFGLELIDAI